MSTIRDTSGNIEEGAIAEAYEQVYRYAFMLTGSRDEAEDLTQETVVKTLVRSRKNPPVSNVTAYMIRVVLHEFFRARQRLARLHDAEKRAKSGSILTSVDTHTYELISALDILSPRERATIVARYYLNLSEAETAESMKCSTGSVKQYTSRALGKLRSKTHLESPYDKDVSTGVTINR